MGLDYLIIKLPRVKIVVLSSTSARKKTPASWGKRTQSTIRPNMVIAAAAFFQAGVIGAIYTYNIPIVFSPAWAVHAPTNHYFPTLN